jgi:hypothetical protein
MRVGAFETAKVGALAGPGAGDEEGHRRLLGGGDRAHAERQDARRDRYSETDHGFHFSSPNDGSIRAVAPRARGAAWL